MRVKSQELIDYLRDVLPPFFARKDVEKFTQGIITRRQLEMMDYRGTGPVCTKMRTRIYYKEEDFIAWLERAEGEYRVEDYTQYGVRNVRNSGEEEVSPR